MNRNRLFNVLIILSFVGVAILGFGQTSDAHIKDAPNFSVPDENTVIESKYNFIAKFTKNTTVETFGNAWYTTKSVEKKSDYFTINYSDVIKDKVGVIYRNVGTYNGEVIDLKITINDVINAYTKQEPQISYGKTQIEHMHKGVQGVDQTWEYISHETQKPVNISGFMTINDIDYLQSIKFDKETSSKITQIFGSADSWIQFENINDEFRFFEENDEGSDDDDLFATFTFTYEESSKLRFVWSYESSNFNENMTWNKDVFDGVYFGYIAKKPAKSEINAPLKNVSDSDETETTENTLSDETEHYSYQVSHSVSDEYEEFYYKNYEMSDVLEPVLKLENIKVLNENGDDVTSYFDNKSTENNVLLVAKKEVLEKPEFYGHTYKFEIHVSLKEDADLTKYTDADGKIMIPNIAKVTVDNSNKETNKVITYIPPKVVEKPEIPVTPTPEKPKPEPEIIMPATGGIDMGKTTLYLMIVLSVIGIIGVGIYIKKKRA